MTEPLASDELALQAAARLANVSFALLHRRLPSVVSGTRVYWTLLLGHHVARGGVDGDFVETGVYKGGTTIAMLRVLAEANASRSHWACDSFEGLPDPEPQDAACPHAGAGAHGCAHNWTRGHFASSRAVFEENVRKWSSSRQPLGLQRLRVVPGWFNSTLPSMGMRAIAFLRLDGDAYSSTRDERKWDTRELEVGAIHDRWAAPPGPFHAWWRADFCINAAHINQKASPNAG